MSVTKIPRDFPCDEGLSSPGALVVEEDPVAGEHAVRLAVVDNHPVSVQLGNTVRGSAVANFMKLLQP